MRPKAVSDPKTCARQKKSETRFLRNVRHCSHHEKFVVEGLRRSRPPEDVVREHGVDRVDGGKPEVKDELGNSQRERQKSAHEVLGRLD